MNNLTPPHLLRWNGLRLLEAIQSGHRNEIWRGTLRGASVSVRHSRRPIASLDWELDLMEHLDQEGFVVPGVIPANDGTRHVHGIVVQRWLQGRPPSSGADWHDVATELTRLHDLTSGYPQRPESCVVTELRTQRRSVDADLDTMSPADRELVLTIFDAMGDIPATVIHGDPGASNIRLTSDGRVGLLDWDESRVDLVWLDISQLGVEVLDPPKHAAAQELTHAWEAVNGWVVERDYARGHLAALRRAVAQRSGLQQ